MPIYLARLCAGGLREVNEEGDLEHFDLVLFDTGLDQSTLADY